MKKANSLYSEKAKAGFNPMCGLYYLRFRQKLQSALYSQKCCAGRCFVQAGVFDIEKVYLSEKHHSFRNIDFRLKIKYTLPLAG